MANKNEIIVENLDCTSDNNSDLFSTSQISTSEEIDFDSPELPKSLLKWYRYLSDEYKDNGKFWELAKLEVSLLAELADLGVCLLAELAVGIKSLLDVVKITAAHVYVNALQLDLVLLDYLSDLYFPSTDKEDTIVHTGQDPIHECHSPMSKAKYVPVSQKHNPNVKSPTPIKGCVLGLPNVDTWDDILKNFGMRTPGRCADKWMNGKDYGKDNHYVLHL
ncbi:hypothetical protein Tco_0305040 [Tanacetum coccineum]